MDFADLTTLVIGARPDTPGGRWPIAVHTDDAVRPLAPVSSYGEALRQMTAVGADRLFVPEQVLGEMVRAGVGPEDADPAA